MAHTITIDWKLVAALGCTTIGIILATKMTPDMVERVSTHAVDACRDYAVAVKGNC